jgi:hypothetical protein
MHSRIAVLLGPALLATVAAAAREPQPTIVDYFLRLPPEVLEGPAKSWLSLSRIDIANGYLTCTGDGAQPAFVVALFRYSDGRPLLALAQAELEADPTHHTFLQLFQQAPDGHMRPAPRSIFPVKDGKGRLFELPRHGRTIAVRDTKTGNTLQRFTWTGEKFEREK